MDAMDTILTHEPAIMATRARPSVVTRLVVLLTRIRWAFTLNRSRVALSELTDYQLADIGISRAEADRESGKISLF